MEGLWLRHTRSQPQSAPTSWRGAETPWTPPSPWQRSSRVVRPHMCGLGGDAWALYLEAATGRVHALNGSGRAGSLATPEFYSEGAGKRSPALHVTVPGAVAAYVDAHERFGSRPLSELLAPAIGLARDGFPVSEYLAMELAKGRGALPSGTSTPYYPRDEAPAAGSLLHNPALANTLEAVALDGRQAFYEGKTAETLSSFLQAWGGHILPKDFATHESEWVEPLESNHFGLEWFALPPNSQGIAFLQQLGMVQCAGIESLAPGSADLLHSLIEVKKLAFADRDRWIGDPAFSEIPLDRLLDAEYLHNRTRLIHPDRASVGFPPGLGGQGGTFQPLAPPGGDTVFLTAVDSLGNGVSWIQSIFSPFGSGLFEPTTGILFHNRGASFRLEAGHPNEVAPGKRPFHTLSPLIAATNGKLAFTLGTPGADGQTQTLLQVALNRLLFGMGPQEAIAAPRLRSFGGLEVAVENRFLEPTLEDLERRGHELRRLGSWASTMGGAQMILVDSPNTSLSIGADPRREARGEIL